MIMYTYENGLSSATLYVWQDGRGFVPSINIPLGDLHAELATLLRTKSRLAGTRINVYLDGRGAVIDTPEELQCAIPFRSSDICTATGYTP